MSSSTAEPPPTSSPSPSPTDHSDRGGSGTSSNLYLVTFLATLFLLLFVSCAIVMRSYILRRRFQREQDDHLAAGRFLAPRTQGSKRKRFGAKPKLFDTWLADGGVTWDHIKPLSAQPVFVKRKYRDGRVPKDGIIISGGPQQINVENLNANVNDSGSPQGVATGHPLRSPLRHLWSRSRRTSTPPQEPDAEEADGLDAEIIAASDLPPSPGGANLPPSGATAGTPAITYKVRIEMLQVSVVIAMPSQDRTIKKNKALDSMEKNEIETEDEDDDEDSSLPEIVFGVTRVNYRQPKPQKPTDATSTSQQKQIMPTVQEEEL
ncbi:hypothetical protein CVT25_012895 [Psilocybe cyanescens]|uniref:Uncharacterized protein n=1 Tax=Psilocybe cyanescens TaxID=93625 RepID=A0A409XLP4_PSICY|nr:hypothetical protein CVT25_012895 [Psilocybe cyanescens]